MAATIFIEQDTGIWCGHPHRHHGYSSGFSPRQRCCPDRSTCHPLVHNRPAPRPIDPNVAAPSRMTRRRLSASRPASNASRSPRPWCTERRCCLGDGLDAVRIAALPLRTEPQHPAAAAYAALTTSEVSDV